MNTNVTPPASPQPNEGTPPTTPDGRPAFTDTGKPATPPAEGAALTDPPVEGTPPTPAPEPAPDAPEPLTLEALTLPEGFEPDEEQLGSFLELANENGLNAESASKMLALHNTFMEQVSQDLTAQWTATQDEWREQVRALPEIGGANLDRSLGEIAKLLDRHGSTEARDAFRATGAGNHPAIVQFLYNVAKDSNEQPPVSGTPAPTETKDRASRMFGSSN